MSSWRHALAGVIAAASTASAQTPAGGPPPSSPRTDGGYVHELLPDLGHIGAQVGFRSGFCVNPYDAGRGPCGGGFVALPVARALGGRLSYEIQIDFARSRGGTFTITNPLAYVANLAAGAPPAAAAVGPPGAPFPVRREVRTELRLLRVSPFGLRYSFSSGAVPRLRPYLSLGPDIVVVLTRQDPVRDEIADPLAAAAFDGPLIGGLTAQAPELADLGLPSGQGNLRVGGHGAFGVELRLSSRLSVNVEYAFTAIESSGGGQHAAVGVLGFHW
jgi:hypothetical protein